MAKNFEELKVWETWRNLYNQVSWIFNNDFKDFFFKDQILRATLSITNNIAEWFERETHKEFVRFLYIARGFCGEVRSMLYIALDKKYISQKQFDELFDVVKHINIMLYKLIQSIQKK